MNQPVDYRGLPWCESCQCWHDTSEAWANFIKCREWGTIPIEEPKAVKL